MAKEFKAPELLENWLATSTTSMSEGSWGYPGMRVELGPQSCARLGEGEALCLPCLHTVHKKGVGWDIWQGVPDDPDQHDSEHAKGALGRRA